MPFPSRAKHHPPSPLLLSLPSSLSPPTYYRRRRRQRPAAAASTGLFPSALLTRAPRRAARPFRSRASLPSRRCRNIYVLACSQRRSLVRSRRSSRPEGETRSRGSRPLWFAQWILLPRERESPNRRCTMASARPPVSSLASPRLAAIWPPRQLIPSARESLRTDVRPIVSRPTLVAPRPADNLVAVAIRSIRELESEWIEEWT